MDVSITVQYTHTCGHEAFVALNDPKIRRRRLQRLAISAAASAARERSLGPCLNCEVLTRSLPYRDDLTTARWAGHVTERITHAGLRRYVEADPGALSLGDVVVGSRSWLCSQDRGYYVVKGEGLRLSAAASERQFYMVERLGSVDHVNRLLAASVA